MEVEYIYYLNKALYVKTFKSGYRAGIDTVLLASAVKAKPKDKVLDLGCGIGVASFCLLTRNPEVECIGLEKNLDFFKLSQENKQLHSHLNFTPLYGNLLDYNFSEKFDIVICNPPYYKYNEISPLKSNKQATNVEEDATLKDFVTFSLDNLAPNGTLYMVHRVERIEELLLLLNKKPKISLEIFPIYSYIYKKASRFIIKATKGNRKPFIHHFGLVVHEEDGTYTEEVKRILNNCESLYSLQKDTISNN